MLLAIYYYYLPNAHIFLYLMHDRTSASIEVNMPMPLNIKMDT